MSPDELLPKNLPNIEPWMIWFKTTCWKCDSNLFQDRSVEKCLGNMPSRLECILGAALSKTHLGNRKLQFCRINSVKPMCVQEILYWRAAHDMVALDPPDRFAKEPTDTEPHAQTKTKIKTINTFKPRTCTQHPLFHKPSDTYPKQEIASSCCIHNLLRGLWKFARAL
jgi:hypothetical protein